MFWRLLLVVIALGLGTIVFSYSFPLTPGTGTRLKVSTEYPNDITVGWVGDMVPSKDAAYNHTVLSFVTPALTEPDLMIGNLEGTFAAVDRSSKCIYLLNRCYAFRGDPSFAEALKTAGFDFVSLVNNHSYDYGDMGLADTTAVLDAAGIPYVSPTSPATSIVVKGKRIGILGLSSTEPTRTITDYDFIKENVAQLKQENDFVIVLFHGGNEGADKTSVPGMNEYMGTEDRGNVALVAHTAIDAGADLVLGAGPHVLRKIETYKGKKIAYSLGNFVGGNGALVTNGTLGLSGIFTSTLSYDHTPTHTFTSVILTKNGTPTFDPLNRGKEFIEQLSQ